VAAGNTGPGRMTIGSPGIAESVLTVGAVDRIDTIASFSSRGPTADGRVKPDIVMPGTDIISARAAGTSLGTVQGQYYTALSGTSMACPMAAGLCALALQAKPSLRPAELKAMLMQSSVDLHVDANAQGFGRADARRLFAALDVPVTERPTTPSEPVPAPTEPAMPDEPTPSTPVQPGCLLGWLGALRRR